jgi:exopolyphosphatase/guanosine-5'-triphosphate,3'-diphosphate pyrophosphatase
MLEAAALPLRRIGFDFVALTSGTANAIAELIAAQKGQSPASPSSRQVAFQDLLALEDKLCALNAVERARLPLDPKRTDSIVPGVILVRSLLEVLHADAMQVCDAALREGLVADWVARNRPGIQLVEEFPDLRRRSVMGLARRCGYQQAHAEQVARLALNIFRATRALHGLTNADGELLDFACVLCEIGYHISPARHHKHGAYLIENYDMKGFSADEVAVLAQVVRYHRKATPQSSHEGFARLAAPLKRKVRILAGILRVASGLDRSYAGLVRELNVKVTDKVVTLEVTASADVTVDVWGARRKRDLFEEVFNRKLRVVVVDAVHPAD